MTVEMSEPRSRRALLAAAAGAAVATVASAPGRPSPVNAATGFFDSTSGDTAALRAFNTAPTGGPAYGVDGRSSSIDGIAVRGWAAAPSGTTYGVQGLSQSTSGMGVRGYADADSGLTHGVYGQSESASGIGVGGASGGNSTGVMGRSGTGTPLAPSPKTGVYGYAVQDSDARGVYGETTVGQGVRGAATSGTGVLATATTGTALRVAGKASFSRSGTASVLPGKSYVDVTVPGGLASNSVVHATLQTYRSGVAIAAARKNYPSAGKVRIYLTKVGSTTSKTSLGWWVAEY